MSKKVLGKGLSALLPQSEEPVLTTEAAVGREKLVYFKISELSPNPLQPRNDFAEEALQQLAESIKSQGILQPLVVSRGSDDRWHIIVGERRWRAAQLAGLKEVPALLVELSPLETVETALVENLQRENLNPLEEAQALNFLLSRRENTQEELANRLGKSRSYISNTLRLLDLDEEMKEDIKKGILTPGHARAALSLTDRQKRLEFWREIKKLHLSVRQAEDLSRKYNGIKPLKKLNLSPEIEELAEKITEKLGQKVNIRMNKKGRGKMVIHFDSVDNLAQVVDTFFSGISYER